MSHSAAETTSATLRRPDVLARAAGAPLVSLLRALEQPGPVPFMLPFAASQGPTIRTSDGVERLNFGSNDYQGLTGDPRVIEGGQKALQRFGTGASGSRLLNGNLSLYLEFERELADFFGVEDAVLLPTGYTANLAALAGLMTEGDIVLIDQRAHASLLDGARLSGAEVRRFAHNDPVDLARHFRGIRPEAAVLVAVDGVYSMEGDVAELPEITKVVRAHGARLLVDEAHGLGVLGERGRGAAEELRTLELTDIMTITMSKSLASCGGALLGPADVLLGLRTLARPYLFAASGVPAAVGAAQAALKILASEPERVPLVRAIAAKLRSGLGDLGWNPLPGSAAIVAVPVGDTHTTAAVWRALFARGIYANAALFPAVAAGSGLLRFSVMATQTEAHLNRLLDVVSELPVPTSDFAAA